MNGRAESRESKAEKDSTTLLYLITPPSIELATFPDLLAEAIDAGDGLVGAVQLRLKDTSDDAVLRAAESLLPVCVARDVAFLVNDRADLSKKAGADGVHLGQDDGSVADARKLLGENAVIGVSCHDSRHLAMEAGEAGADYVAFGAFYPTTSKRPEELARRGVPAPDILEWWSTWTELPCVAIGGITPTNAAPLVRAGADFLAVITAVWSHPEGPGAAVKAFRDML